MRPEQGNDRFREAVARVMTERMEFFPGVLVTVMDARIASNQANAMVLLSVLPASQQEKVLTILLRNIRHFKNSLAHELRLRQIPEIHWEFDTSGTYVEKIDETIHELKKKGDL